MVDASGTIYRGSWRDGELSGVVSVELRDGCKREAKYVMGVMHGPALYTDTEVPLL